jgi:hypothetical protein
MVSEPVFGVVEVDGRLRDSGEIHEAAARPIVHRDIVIPPGKAGDTMEVAGVGVELPKESIKGHLPLAGDDEVQVLNFLESFLGSCSGVWSAERCVYMRGGLLHCTGNLAGPRDLVGHCSDPHHTGIRATHSI